MQVCFFILSLLCLIIIFAVPCYWGFFNIAAERVADDTHKWSDKVFNETGLCCFCTNIRFTHLPHSFKVYPPYALGTAYVLSHQLVQYIIDLNNESPLTMYPNEDVAVGVWLRDARALRVEALWNLMPFVSAYETSQQEKCEGELL